MKLTLAKVGWMICLAAVAVVCISAINHKKTSVVQAIDVHINKFDEGEYFLTEADVQKEIEAIIGVEEGLLMTEVHVGQIENALHANPFIADVDVYLSSDEVLGVTVVQRQPLARVFDAQGKTYYMDREGMIIPVSEYFTARVPVITGHVLREAKDQAPEEVTPWDELFELVSTLDNNTFMKPMIEQLDISKDQVITMVPKVGQTTIVFGPIENTEAKLKNLETFYKDVIAVYGWDLYETIDLTIPDQVVVKKKPNHN